MKFSYSHPQTKTIPIKSNTVFHQKYNHAIYIFSVNLLGGGGGKMGCHNTAVQHLNEIFQFTTGSCSHCCNVDYGKQSVTGGKHGATATPPHSWLKTGQ